MEVGPATILGGTATGIATCGAAFIPMYAHIKEWSREKHNDFNMVRLAKDAFVDPADQLGINTLELRCSAKISLDFGGAPTEAHDEVIMCNGEALLLGDGPLGPRPVFPLGGAEVVIVDPGVVKLVPWTSPTITLEFGTAASGVSQANTWKNKLEEIANMGSPPVRSFELRYSALCQEVLNADLRSNLNRIGKQNKNLEEELTKLKYDSEQTDKRLTNELRAATESKIRWKNRFSQKVLDVVSRQQKQPVDAGSNTFARVASPVANDNHDESDDYVQQQVMESFGLIEQLRSKLGLAVSSKEDIQKQLVVANTSIEALRTETEARLQELQERSSGGSRPVSARAPAPASQQSPLKSREAQMGSPSPRVLAEAPSPQSQASPAPRTAPPPESPAKPSPSQATDESTEAIWATCRAAEARAQDLEQHLQEALEQLETMQAISPKAAAEVRQFQQVLAEKENEKQDFLQQIGRLEQWIADNAQATAGAGGGEQQQALLEQVAFLEQSSADAERAANVAVQEQQLLEADKAAMAELNTELERLLAEKMPGSPGAFERTEALKAQNSALVERAVELERLLAEHQQGAMNAIERSQALEADNSEFGDRIFELERALADAQGGAANAEEQIKLLQAAQQDLVDAQEQVQQLQVDKASMHGKIVLLEQALEEAQGHKAVADGQRELLQRAEAGKDDLLARHAELEQLTKEAQAQAADAGELQRNAEAGKEAWMARVVELEEAAEEPQHRIMVLEEALRLEVQKGASAIEERQGEVDAAAKQRAILQDAEVTRQALLTRNTELERMVMETQGAAAVVAEQHQLLQEAEASLEREKAGKEIMLSRIAELERVAEEAQGQAADVAEQRGFLQDAEANREVLLARVAELERLAEDGASKVTEQNGLLETLEAERRALAERIAALTQNLEEAQGNAQGNAVAAAQLQEQLSEQLDFSEAEKVALHQRVVLMEQAAQEAPSPPSPARLREHELIVESYQAREAKMMEDLRYREQWGEEAQASLTAMADEVRDRQAESETLRAQVAALEQQQRAQDPLRTLSPASHGSQQGDRLLAVEEAQRDTQQQHRQELQELQLQHEEQLRQQEAHVRQTLAGGRATEEEVAASTEQAKYWHGMYEALSFKFEAEVSNGLAEAQLGGAGEERVVPRATLTEEELRMQDRQAVDQELDEARSQLEEQRRKYEAEMAQLREQVIATQDALFSQDPSAPPMILTTESITSPSASSLPPTTLPPVSPTASSVGNVTYGAPVSTTASSAALANVGSPKVLATPTSAAAVAAAAAAVAAACANTGSPGQVHPTIRTMPMSASASSLAASASNMKTVSPTSVQQASPLRVRTGGSTGSARISEPGALQAQSMTVPPLAGAGGPSLRERMEVIRSGAAVSDTGGSSRGPSNPTSSRPDLSQGTGRLSGTGSQLQVPEARRPMPQALSPKQFSPQGQLSLQSPVLQQKIGQPVSSTTFPFPVSPTDPQAWVVQRGLMGQSAGGITSSVRRMAQGPATVQATSPGSRLSPPGITVTPAAGSFRTMADASRTATSLISPQGGLQAGIQRPWATGASLQAPFSP